MTITASSATAGWRCYMKLVSGRQTAQKDSCRTGNRQHDLLVLAASSRCHTGGMNAWRISQSIVVFILGGPRYTLIESNKGL